MNARRLERALDLFRRMQQRGRFPGGQLAVHHRGALVVDLAVGDGWRPADAGDRVTRAVTTETPFCVWSASKPLVAMTVAHLDERRLVDVQAPVLTHRSGVIVPDLGQERGDWSDWKKGLAKVLAAKPRYPRGTTVYHPYEFGWILAAVVEAVTGRPFVDVFADAIAGPAELAPMRFFVGAAETAEVAHTYLLGKKPIVVSGVRYDRDFEQAANHAMLTSFVPGGSMMTTARVLSAFYATVVDGVAPNGRRIFEAQTVADYTRPQAAGCDPLNRLPFAFARGFLVGGIGPSLFGPWRTASCVGHGGALCSFGFADRATGLAGAILTNGNWSVPEFVIRFGRLVHGLRSACT
jgi:CubicO group peptidase (beta-lactamase class C family)